MSNRSTHPAKRAAAGVVAGTLALSGVAVAAGASTAHAVPGFAFERIEGANRYATAAAIAAETFPTGASVAIVARGDVFADALAANYLAGAVGAPVLLTASRSLPGVTAQALADLGVDTVVIVGGTTAVSTDVEKALDADYAVERLGGTDRYLTAELVAMATAEVTNGSVGLLNGLRTAILGSGQAFPDVLAAAPLSYAGDHPLVISRPTDLPDASEDVLIGLDVEQVVIVGGTDAVSQAVEDEVELITGNPVVRLFGENRYQTAAAIAQAAYDDFGFDDSHVNLARGDDFADALAGGPHGGEELSPILLTAPTALSTATRTFLENNSGTLVDGHIFGGLEAVEADVEQAAEDAAQGEAPVPGDTTAPAAALVTSPTAATTTTSATFPITGTAEAGATVRVLNASTRTQLGSGTASSTGSFSIDLDLAEGANDVVVVVVDAAGNTSADTVVATITQDTTAPTASLEAGAGGSTTIVLTFSEDVADTTVTAGDITVNGTALTGTNATVTTAAGAGGTDVTTVTLTTPLAGGDVVTLASGSVEDVAGNTGPAAAATDTVGPGADTTGPTFAAAAVIGGSQDLVLTYSEPLDCTTVEADGRDYEGTYGTATIAPIGAVCDASTVTLTFPNSPFASGVSGTIGKVDTEIVTDVAGNDQPDTDTVNYTVS